MKQIILLLVSIFVLGCNQDSQILSSKNDLPNIVYIFADDLGYGDIGCFGATDIKTPNVDRIATEGIKFTSFYSASPVCSPSRAALLTGRMPQRMGINAAFFPSSFTGMSPDEITIAEVLKEKNYATGIVGKWHLGHHEKFLPLQQGFDSYYGIPYSNDMRSIVYMKDNEVDSFHVNQRLTTKLYTQKAIEFIQNKKDEPFFLYVAHNMPHVPLYASDEFLGSSERGLYGDVIQEIDWSVGQILKELEASDLLENTLVVFSSDNGPWLVMEDHGGSSGGLKAGKFYSFEGGMRVPTVAMWKGKIRKGTVHEEMVVQTDWFPTFANLVGVTLDQNRIIDGKDISNVLFENQYDSLGRAGGKREDDSFLFFERGELMGYRKGDWKVKLPFEGFKGARWKIPMAAHDSLLINLKNDVGERKNVFAKNKVMARNLFKEMNEKYRAMGVLPKGQVIRTMEDHSHFEYLKNKTK